MLDTIAIILASIAVVFCLDRHVYSDNCKNVGVALLVTVFCYLGGVVTAFVIISLLERAA